MPLSRQSQPRLRSLLAIPVAVSFALGIGAAMLLSDVALIWPAVVGTALVGVACAMFAVTRRPGFMLICAAAGMADMGFAMRPVDIPEGKLVYSGEVVRTVDNGSHPVAYVEIDRLHGRAIRPALVTLTADSVLASVGQGDRITFRAAFSVPSNVPVIPDEITGYELLMNRGVTATAFISVHDIIASEPASGFRAVSGRIRLRLLETLYSSDLDGRSKEFLATALLGERDAVSSDTRDAFTRAGLSHILALSGLHVAVIAGLFFWVLAPLVLVTPRHLRNVLLLVAIWGYAFMTGLGASVVRASVMASIVILGDLSQRRSIALNSLFVAALIVLVFSPEQLASIGFQLSVLATGAIIAFADALNPFDRSRNPFLRRGGEAVGVSLAAMLATVLLSALHFHTVPLLFIVPNVTVGAFAVPVILAGGLIVIACSAAGVPCGLVTLAVDGMTRLLTSTADRISEVPWASVTVWGLSGATVALVIVMLSVAALRLYGLSDSTGMLTMIVPVLAIGAIVMAFTISPMKPRDPEGTRYVIDNRDGIKDVVVPSGARVFLVSDAPPTTLESRAERYRQRLRRYMGLRDIDTLTAISPRDTSLVFSIGQNR